MMRTPCLALISLLACNPGGGEPTTTDASTGTTAAEAGSQGTTIEPTGPADTTTVDTTDAEPTTAEPTTAVDTTAADTTSVDTTDAETTDTTGDAVDTCLAVCARLAECDAPFAEGCAEECALTVGVYSYPGPECLANYIALAECKLAASCDELADPPVEQCSAADDALYSEACASDVCLAHADHIIECGFLDPEGRIPHAIECTYGVAYALDRGQSCLDATEALYACVAVAPCDEIQSGEVCMDKEDEQKMICGL